MKRSNEFSAQAIYPATSTRRKRRSQRARLGAAFDAIGNGTIAFAVLWTMILSLSSLV